MTLNSWKVYSVSLTLGNPSIQAMHYGHMFRCLPSHGWVTIILYARFKILRQEGSFIGEEFRILAMTQVLYKGCLTKRASNGSITLCEELAMSQISYSDFAFLFHLSLVNSDLIERRCWVYTKMVLLLI